MHIGYGFKFRDAMVFELANKEIDHLWLETQL